MPKPSKKLYKGSFNFSGEQFELFTRSSSTEKAFLNFISQLAKLLNVGKRTVLFKFDGSVDNYFIEEVRHEKV